MHPYRSHTCAELDLGHAGQTVRLAGWVHRKRDHGGLLFIDLRDHYGITQLVVDGDSPAFAAAEAVRAEWVIRVDGLVKARAPRARQPEDPDRGDRGLCERAGGAGGGGGAAAAGVRRGGISRGDKAQVPVPRPAAGGARPPQVEEPVLEPCLLWIFTFFSSSSSTSARST